MRALRREGVAYGMIGDFNRSGTASGEFYAALESAGLAPLAPLDERPRCHRGRYRSRIDHILLDAAARQQFQPGTVREETPTGRPSDHCPLSVSLG